MNWFKLKHSEAMGRAECLVRIDAVTLLTCDMESNLGATVTIGSTTLPLTSSEYRDLAGRLVEQEPV